MNNPYTSMFASIPVDGPLTPPSSDKVNPVDPHNDCHSLDQLCLGDALLPLTADELDARFSGIAQAPAEIDTKPASEAAGAWRPGMSIEERKARRDWLMEGRGRKGLRIVIVTENFLPKVDGVTRTLARLLEHLEREGHECMVLGPQTGMTHYASHPLVGTLGIPLVVYSGLKLNFLRPRFLCRIHDFQPDVVHLVDPIWLGGQTTVAMERGWAGTPWDKRIGHKAGEDEIQGAVVASYHTNLGTYATLFGMSWLEPCIWALQRWLHSKYNLTMCPSPSTASLLRDKRFADESCRIWPRGVELKQFHPSKRSPALRRSWGVLDPDTCFQSETQSLQQLGEDLLTPPGTPVMHAADGRPGSPTVGSGRVVLLYVGRISWEKNLKLLLRALMVISRHLPPHCPPVKAVFVGDGPARAELEATCKQEKIDATFMGQVVGEPLAECFASADVFCFPSFTETFGQVVLEALASGLPVVGLDADGTKDLVKDESTGLLLRLPDQNQASRSTTLSAWPQLCKDASAPIFATLADQYAALIARMVLDGGARNHMSRIASTDGIKGFTWWDAMERCVDGYRESMRISKVQQEARLARQRASPYAGLARQRDRLLTLMTSRTALTCIILALAFLHFLRIPSERLMTVAAAP